MNPQSKTKLFSQYQLGPLVLEHRVVMPPLTRLRSNPDDSPSDMMVTHYAQRASKGGLIQNKVACPPSKERHMDKTKNKAVYKRTVIVAGSQGISAKGVFERYASLPNTTVYGLSRRQAESSGNAAHISVDLLDPKEVAAEVGNLGGVTHLVFGAYIEKQTAAERSQVNTALLKNLLDVLEKSAPGLEHITIHQGGKAYGSDLGPFKTPAREDDPRLKPPNFYYDQENLLRERQEAL
jgi:hypothetical protein